MKEVKPIIEEALASSMSFEAYIRLMKDLVATGQASGPKQNEDLTHYTKLNDQRMNRLTKKIEVTEAMKAAIRQVQSPQTWLIITESWCGDAAQVVPLLQKIADENPLVQTRFVLRDEHLDLMDHFLTRGGRSIPKLIMLDKSNEVLGSWGPRPIPAQVIYDEWRNSENKIPYSEFSVILQKWYLQDKGLSTFDEIASLIRNILDKKVLEQ